MEFQRSRQSPHRRIQSQGDAAGLHHGHHGSARQDLQVDRPVLRIGLVLCVIHHGQEELGHLVERNLHPLGGLEESAQLDQDMATMQ